MNIFMNYNVIRLGGLLLHCHGFFVPICSFPAWSSLECATLCEINQASNCQGYHFVPEASNCTIAAIYYVQPPSDPNPGILIKARYDLPPAGKGGVM